MTLTSFTHLRLRYSCTTRPIRTQYRRTVLVLLEISHARTSLRTRMRGVDITAVNVCVDGHGCCQDCPNPGGLCAGMYGTYSSSPYVQAKTHHPNGCNISSPVRIELTASRLTVGRANQLRHGDSHGVPAWLKLSGYKTISSTLCSRSAPYWHITLWRRGTDFGRLDRWTQHTH